MSTFKRVVERLLDLQDEVSRLHRTIETKTAAIRRLEQELGSAEEENIFLRSNLENLNAKLQEATNG